MDLNRRSLILPLFVAAALIACSILPTQSTGGDAVAVSSRDGVVSLTYSAGAVEGDPDVQILPADIPAELEGLSGTLIAYDLEPSGLQFAQPATIHFELGADVEPEAVPLGLIVVQDDSGWAEALETHVSREGGKVVMSAPLPHFSRTYVWIGPRYFRVDPSTIRMDVGTEQIVDVVHKYADDETLAKLSESENYNYVVRVNPSGSDFISLVGNSYVRCNRATDGVVSQAFDVDVRLSSGELVDDLAQDQANASTFSEFATGLRIVITSGVYVATLSGHVECIDAGPVPTPTDQGPYEEATIDIPPVVTGFDINVEEQGAASCDFKPPSGDGEAILHGSDSGFVLSLNRPFGLGITGDGGGGLASTYSPGPAGFGETGPRQLAVDSLERSGGTLTLQVEEIRFTDGFPDGCSRPYQIEYQFEDGAALDFLERVPSGSSQGTKVDNPNLTKREGSFTLEGQFVNTKPGQVYYAWTQVSAADDLYYLTPISPASDGTFSVTTLFDVSEGDWTIIEVLVDGVPVASTSGEWHSQ